MLTYWSIYWTLIDLLVDSAYLPLPVVYSQLVRWRLLYYNSAMSSQNDVVPPYERHYLRPETVLR